MAHPKGKKAKKKPLTPAQIAHQKFLVKMGVTKKQLKETKAKLADLFEGTESRNFQPDTLQSIRRVYDDD